MTKFILSSSDLGNKNSTLEMYIIFKKFHLKDKNILYISCDASNTDKIAQIYCSSVLGFTNENIYSIENGIPTIIPDYVLLYGKNSFELLAFLKERKLFDYIKHIVNNGCTYIGFGAGAALVGNDIATINYCYSNYCFLKDLTAFNFVDGCVLPHVNDINRFLLISKQVADKYPCFYAVPDNTIIQIDSYGEVLNNSIYMYRPHITN
jgi:peptidase E